MRLNIYTDEAFCEVRETREVERMKLPYGVTKYVLNTLKELDLKNDDAVMQKLLAGEEQLTAVVRATFGLSEDDLPYIDTLELYDLGKEIVAFVIEKMADLGISFEDLVPNAQTPAPKK